jgi:hypothetical protein
MSASTRFALVLLVAFSWPTAGCGSGGAPGAGGSTGTGDATECNPGCTADQDCISGTCVAARWDGMACSTTADCQSWSTCCNGADPTCDATRIPAGDGANAGEFVVSGDGTVTDTITGLVWQRDGSGTRPGCSGSDKSGTPGDITCTWAEAQAYCASLGGASGWRLPSRKELPTIVDFTSYSPANYSTGSDCSPGIDSAVFPNTPCGRFWTSSAWDDSGDAFSVSFGAGDSNHEDVGTYYRVRCVRGSRCYPKSRFSMLAGGLVHDTLTNLVWQRQASATTMPREAAAAYCSSAGAGFRLPTVKELYSLEDPTVSPGANIDHAAFPNTPAESFWTSTPDSDESGEVTLWYVYFYGGYSYTPDHARKNLRVRCISEGGSTGGGGSGGSGGTGGTPGTGGAPTCAFTNDGTARCPTGTGAGSPGLVDDLNDGDSWILQNDGRKGTWYTFNDGTGSQTPPGNPTLFTCASPTNGRMCTSGSGFTSWGAGIGLALNWSPSCAGVYDASAYRGVRFTLSGTIQDGKSLRFGIGTTATSPPEAGGTCQSASACTDSYGAYVTPTTAPQPISFYFSELHQAGWGAVTPWTPAETTTLLWLTDASAFTDVCVDDVAFF